VAHLTERVDRSALRLSEVARHVVIPDGIVDSLWFDVAARCEEFGDSFDVWQDGLGQSALGIRADGMFAATVGGITLSIPRQVAKTFIVMRIVVALCTLFPNLTVIWTAHRMRTATNTFQKMKAFVLRPGVRAYLKAGSNNGTAIRDANGEQEIPFANGSRILFGAREQGFGRGFDEVDIEVFDEAQILTVKALEDMVAATNQSRFQHGALLFYMGTPPRPVDPGEVFAERRAEALAAKVGAGGEDFGAPVQVGDSVYVECSGDPLLDVDDPRQVEIANPSYPHRTPPVAVRRLRKNLPDSGSWRREGLGIWDEESTATALPYGKWRGLADPDAPRGESVVFGADVAEDRSAWIAVAWRRPDGAAQVQLVEAEPFPAFDLVDRCVKLAEAWGGVVVPPRAFEADLEREGVQIQKMTGTEFAGACGDVFDALEKGELRHGNQAALNQAVRAAQWRSVGTAGERAWQLKDVPEIGPLAAATRALWGLSTVTEGVLVW
jgi:hypothetical protein